MGKIIAFCNHKGGVGKTTSAVNIGAAIAEKGSRVLLLDLDPQANLTLSMGLEDRIPNTSQLLRGEGRPSPIPIADRLDGIPSSLDLSAVEGELNQQDKGIYTLREVLRKVKADYHYIIVDCPPSLGMLTINALAAAEEVVITLQPHYLATKGLTKIMEVLQRVQAKINRELTLRGILVTFYDGRKILHRDVVEALEERYPDLLMRTRIRENISLAEAPAEGLDIFRYAPNSNGAQDYREAASELITK